MHVFACRLGKAHALFLCSGRPRGEQEDIKAYFIMARSMGKPP